MAVSEGTKGFLFFGQLHWAYGLYVGSILSSDCLLVNTSYKLLTIFQNNTQISPNSFSCLKKQPNITCSKMLQHNSVLGYLMKTQSVFAQRRR